MSDDQLHHTAWPLLVCLSMGPSPRICTRRAIVLCTNSSTLQFYRLHLGCASSCFKLLRPPARLHALTSKPENGLRRPLRFPLAHSTPHSVTIGPELTEKCRLGRVEIVEHSKVMRTRFLSQLFSDRVPYPRQPTPHPTNQSPTTSGPHHIPLVTY